MSELRSLIEKLNPMCRRALENAVGHCVAQTNYNVEVEHLLLSLLEMPATDIAAVLQYHDVTPEQTAQQLRNAMESFQRGNSRTPAMSPQLIRLMRESWLWSSIEFEAQHTRSGGVLYALLSDGVWRELLPAIPLDATFREAIRDSAEELDDVPPKKTVPVAAPVITALDRFTVDLTAEARSGMIDPIRGRDGEIRQVIDILTRRRQNNPILVGDAGVGKTAVVEGFALAVASGSVPAALRDISLRVLDLGQLQAGAAMKGEFEERVGAVMREVRASAVPIVLFIDEAHTLIGDTANLLKPALARGELRTIAATTWSEYKKYFEKDPALTRRFQLIHIGEPDEENALDMLRGVAPQLERHHAVRILDEAVRSCVQLSHRYLPERRLPDKAIGVLDTAAARVALAQDVTPEAIADLDRRMRIADDASRIEDLETLRAERAQLAERWGKEKKLVAEIRTLQAATVVDDDRIAALIAELNELQQDAPLVPLACDSRVVAAVVSGWTGIPVGRMVADEVRGVLSLQDRMATRIIGQQQALDMICRRISTSRAGLEDPAKPKGVFLLVGPTGVGKTETALTLSDLLYGGERNLITFNMSEFQEAHSVATLKGAPPGYVGYGRGGVLTEAVRRRPWSAVLLDEIEKAHADVVDLFYQVFDKGVLEDGEGVPVDFRHTVILLTSNAGSEIINEACKVPVEKRDVDALVDRLRPELLRYFKPALLARLVIVPFYPLRKREVVRIVELKLKSIERRVREHHAAELTYDPRLVDSLADRCDPASGAREIDQILTQTLLPELSTRILERMAKGASFAKIHVSVDAAGRFI
jgi:type VI secretion system protein VasG